MSQTSDYDQLKGKLDQLWGWAKSGEDTNFYLMDKDNVDTFTRDVLALIKTHDELLHSKVNEALDTYQHRMLKKNEEQVAEAVRKAKLEENAWSRQKMIATQAFDAPNSGFGRMVKWAISLFNERKLELLGEAQLKNKDGAKE